MSRARAGGARDQVARLLTLVPYVHSRGEVRLAEAAATLGVSPEQLLKDLKVLLMCGLPGGYPDDLIDVDLDPLEGPEGAAADGVVRVSNADYLTRPLRLTLTEASALIVALRALRAEADEGTAEAVDRALAKLEAATDRGSETAGRIDPGHDAGSAALNRLRARLEDAVTRRRQVRLTYWVPNRDEESERLVDPRGVVTSGGHDYLDAYCHSAEAPRLFRLDRIHRATVLDTEATSRSRRPRDLASGFFRDADDSRLVTLLLAPGARWVAEYYPVRAVRPLPDDRLEVVLHVADDAWLARLLLRLAPDATVAGPAELSGVLADAARRTLDLYR